MEGGSSRQGVRLSHSVTGSMLTQTSFGLLTIYICGCVCMCVNGCVCEASVTS